MIISNALAESVLKAIFHNTITASLPLADLNLTAGAATNLKIALHSDTVAIGSAQTVNEVSTGTWPTYARLSFANNSTNWLFTSPNQIDNNVLFAWAANSGTATLVKWASIGTGVSDRVLFRMPLALATPRPFVADDVLADRFYVPAHGYADNQEVMFFKTEGDALPSGGTMVADGVLAYVKATNKLTDTFQISAASGDGTALTYTAKGSGFVASVGTKSIGTNDDFKFDATGSNRLTVILR